MFKKFLISAILVSCAAPVLAANNPGVYLGGDMGSTRIDGFDKKSTSYGGFAGYQFTDNLAAELGYRKFASTDAYIAKVDLHQTSLSMIGTFPIGSGNFVFGRLGYNQLKASASYGGLKGSASDTGVLFGAGIGHQFNQNVSARLELQRPSSDSTNFSVAIAYKF
jgi:opacity protein-like surface antigen